MLQLKNQNTVTFKTNNKLYATYASLCSYLWDIPLTYTTNRCNFTHCINAYLLDQKSGMIQNFGSYFNLSITDYWPFWA